MRALVIGCGYVGLPLAETLARSAHEVFGVRRRWEDASAAERGGVVPLTADLTRPADLRRLPGPFDWVVHCASAGGGGLDAYRAVYRDGLQQLIEWLQPTPLTKLVYTSSTGVYGQTDGAEVDEVSSTVPGTATGEVLVAAEQVVRAAAQRVGFPGVVLRVAGIYGPDRGYWLRQFLAGEARVEGAGDRWLNMIHRDDVVGAVIAALERGRPGEVYNATDNEPVRQAELLRWFAQVTGRPMPPTVPVDSPAVRRRGLTSKRIRNRKLREETGWRPGYPTFRDGFAAMLGALPPP